jgi:hypothetical protein
MSSETIQAIEQNIKKARAVIEFGNALERLRNNKDFKKVIVDGYFHDEAVRLVHLKGDPAMQTPQMQQSIINQMDAIAALNQYFGTILQQSSLAAKSVASDEETRDELLEEELING